MHTTQTLIETLREPISQKSARSTFSDASPRVRGFPESLLPIKLARRETYVPSFEFWRQETNLSSRHGATYFGFYVLRGICLK
ncbi:hypothetical protein CEXT_476281 [Caerostris extrusa]|uniref:Uncharacterized protein n=1 Tax=Caerostris extrusa TaxID=172846 RepID=A0AAV4QPI3_CAEEX|nr:hypothetical protein CEXT_476281 [Caerostris extrusa]